MRLGNQKDPHLHNRSWTVLDRQAQPRTISVIVRGEYQSISAVQTVMMAASTAASDPSGNLLGGNCVDHSASCDADVHAQPRVDLRQGCQAWCFPEDKVMGAKVVGNLQTTEENQSGPAI